MALGGAVWLLSAWQPERQVRRHTERFIAAVEGRNWKRLAEITSDDYSDRWGHDKRVMIDRTREVFAQFFALEIEAREISVVEGDGLGTASARLTVRGSGGPLAQLAIERAAALREPFVFTWQQRSGKPWDWVLTRIEQPELDLE